MRTYLLIALFFTVIVTLGAADVVYVLCFSRTAKAASIENATLTHMLDALSLGPDLLVGLPEVAAAARVNPDDLAERCRTSFRFSSADLMVRMKRNRVTDAIVAVREIRRPLDLEPSALPADALAALVLATSISGELASKSTK